ncbi:hypothetical protein ACIPSJ_26925 [Streptomyces sp. NPDC090088]|uniref:hypothetical protein n=1 Tax=Streptomyces sp. NPDC090088 TaxID=3365944 RepID=UPI00382659B5
MEEIERREAAARERIEDGNIGVRAKLYTPDQHDDVKQRDALFTQLQEAASRCAATSPPTNAGPSSPSCSLTPDPRECHHCA